MAEETFEINTFLMRSTFKIIGENSIGKKQGDGSLFANPQLPLTKNTFIRMVFISGKQ